MLASVCVCFVNEFVCIFLLLVCVGWWCHFIWTWPELSLIISSLSLSLSGRHVVLCHSNVIACVCDLSPRPRLSLALSISVSGTTLAAAAAAASSTSAGAHLAPDSSSSVTLVCLLCLAPVSRHNSSCLLLNLPAHLARSRSCCNCRVWLAPGQGVSRQCSRSRQSGGRTFARVRATCTNARAPFGRRRHFSRPQ